MSKKLILATTSPHRKEAFSRLGIPFEMEASNVEEYFDGRPNDPKALVAFLAKLKAEAVAKNHQEPCIIIGFDSVVFFEEKILEKPKSREEIFTRLKAMANKYYQFYTGIHLIPIQSDIEYITQVESTIIQMRNYSDREINLSLDQNPHFKTCAQGFDPQSTYGMTLIESISGSYNNPLWGIPLEVVVEMIQNCGYTI
jgi:septum formation protein